MTLSFLCVTNVQFLRSHVDRMIQDWYKIIQFCYSGIFISFTDSNNSANSFTMSRMLFRHIRFSPKDRTINRRAEAVGRCQVPFSSRTLNGGSIAGLDIFHCPFMYY